MDDVDMHEQLAEWVTTIADVRIHGTTHERPIERFAHEHARLVPTGGQPSFRLEARHARIVASDWLVSFETNRYSVPFTLIGQPVEVGRGQGGLQVFHRGQLVAAHELLTGKYQVRILPEHGPGALARNPRQLRSAPRASAPPAYAEVEVRDLGVYEILSTPGEGETEIAAPLPIASPDGSARSRESHHAFPVRTGAGLASVTA